MGNTLARIKQAGKNFEVVVDLDEALNEIIQILLAEIEEAEVASRPTVIWGMFDYNLEN